MLNKALRLIRVFHDMSQTKLAKKLGISKSYLSEIESGKKTISVNLLDNYVKVFNIPASSLLLFSENLKSDKLSERTRVFAANKIIKILDWIALSENDAEEINSYPPNKQDIMDH